MASATVESYVKTVYRLAQGRGDRPVTTGELAEAMGVSPGTVTSMLKTLHDAELATYTPYEGARLTESGRRLALRMFRRHRLLECFLSKSLGLAWDEVHEDAGRIEHEVSDTLIERIDEYLGHPRFDPHGDPIPAADGTVALVNGVPLVECAVGTRLRLAQVTNQSPEFLRYLTDSGLSIGATVLVRANRAEAGVVVLEVGGREVTLGRDVADHLIVARLETGGRDLASLAATASMLSHPALRDAPGAAR